VGAAGRRQARADVEELAYPSLTSQVADSAGQERPVRPSAGDHLRGAGRDLLSRLAVGRMAVLAA
jgi:hypothetical protein